MHQGMALGLSPVHSRAVWNSSTLSFALLKVPQIEWVFSSTCTPSHSSEHRCLESIKLQGRGHSFLDCQICPGLVTRLQGSLPNCAIWENSPTRWPSCQTPVKNSRVPKTTFRFDNLLGQLTEFRKALYLWLQVCLFFLIVKAYKLKVAKETHRTGPGGVEGVYC